MESVGGAQVHVRDIAVRLKESGHKIYLIAGGEGNIYQELKEEELLFIKSKNLIRKVSFLSDIKAILEIRKILKDIGPDIIATHSSKAGVVGRIAGWSLRIPTVFTAHGWSYTEGVPKLKQRMYILFEKTIARISKGVIAVSEYDKQLAIKYKVLPERKIITIRNGVHDIQSDHFKPLVRSVKKPSIVMVARFAAPKKQIQLLRALSLLQHLDWEVSFAGDGPLLKEAQDYARDIGISNRVHFLGDCQDVTKLLHNSHLFVLLSDWEGLPLSILEAMRCGLPIIASDVGGVSEAVTDGLNGYLIPKDDLKLLIEKLAYLLKNTNKGLEMGDQGRAIYKADFSFSRMYEETLTYYQEVIKTQKR